MEAVDQGKAGWSPDWATHPGEHLEERIEVRGWTQAEFARRADMTPKLVSDIINGKNPVTPETAIKLERVLGLKSYIWLGIQSGWDLHEARQREQAKVDALAGWVKRFPVKEMRAQRLLPDTKDLAELADKLLAFFGAGTIEGYQSVLGSLAVQHRQSGAHQSLPDHVFAWLTVGEHLARSMQLPEFDPEKFAEAVAEIRLLTVEVPEVFEPEMVRLCKGAGVALVFTRPLGQNRLYGSARWIDGSRRAVIQLSLRAKSNDHFWWTFFHECGHVMLHRGKSFADNLREGGNQLEDEANRWAETALYGVGGVKEICSLAPRSEAAVRHIAENFGLHPGVIVGMLQHHGCLPHTHLNGLKVKFAWKS